MQKPYFSYNQYLRSKYGVSAYKVAVDAGFSCPNRGEDRTRPGCTYCEEHGARATYLDKETRMEEQIRRTLRFLKKRYGAEVFLLYFQAFSGTYAPLDKLRSIYDFTLGLEDFRELIVSTRPDCVEPDTADLLAGYRNERRDVWCELGIQSFHDRTLERINRGHSVARFYEAFNLLRSRGIKLTVHLIFGLPGESWTDMRYSLECVNRLKPEALKIHNLHIPRRTPMGAEFLRGEITAPCSRRHLGYVVRALRLLDPEIIIQRLTCDTKRERLAAPRNFWKKSRFYVEVQRAMQSAGSFQGCEYDPPDKGV